MQKNVTEWLDQTAKLFPDKAAIVEESGTLSFREYRRKALAIARELISCGVGRREPVVVYMEKSAKVLVSFLGIAYSGNFYSPIDVEMPASRVDKILEILQPQLVITTEGLKGQFEAFGYGGEYLLWEDVSPDEGDEARVRPISNQIIDTDLLYVLFTSGSTGVPKGVSITHRGVIDFIDSITETFEMCSEDSFGNQANFYFDLSVHDIYCTLKTGATLCIIPKELFRKPVQLLEYLRENSINTVNWVPTSLIMISKMRALEKVDMSGVLKRVMFAGEAMPNVELNKWRSSLPDVLYANKYGPTEITCECLIYKVDRKFEDADPLPIGTPMPNMGVMLLDEKDQLIGPEKINQIGELCITGTGLSPGYYRDLSLTQKVFTQNPFNDRYEEKMYRTGDLAYYNELGEFVFAGRKDFQIKHLGHRVELGEIEVAVSLLADVDRCCCLYDQKHSRIVMFISSKNAVSRETIRNHLLKTLPTYMIPEKIIQLEEMPLNANGKIDRNSLKETL